jgi:hypothetical protein
MEDCEEEVFGKLEDPRTGNARTEPLCVQLYCEGGTLVSAR